MMTCSKKWPPLYVDILIDCYPVHRKIKCPNFESDNVWNLSYDLNDNYHNESRFKSVIRLPQFQCIKRALKKILFWHWWIAFQERSATIISSTHAGAWALNKPERAGTPSRPVWVPPCSSNREERNPFQAENRNHAHSGSHGTKRPLWRKRE